MRVVRRGACGYASDGNYALAAEKAFKRVMQELSGDNFVWSAVRAFTSILKALGFLLIIIGKVGLRSSTGGGSRF